MKPYEILEHVSELRMRITGVSEPELFQNAAYALADILAPDANWSAAAPAGALSRAARDRPMLLVDFLNELLARSLTLRQVYRTTHIALTDTMLETQLLAAPVERFHEDIKAATHHNVRIEELSDRTWQADIIFDI